MAAFHREVFEVGAQQFFRRAVAHVRGQVEDLVPQLLHIHPRPRGQVGGDPPVLSGGGGAMEQQRIGQDAGEQHPGNIRRHVEVGFGKQLGHDGAGRADRLHAHKRRGAGLEIGHPVVIDHAHDLGFLDAGHRLAALVVVDQHHPPLYLPQQAGAAHQPHHRALLVDHHQRAHHARAQRLAHVVHQVVRMAGDDCGAHDVGHRGAQVDQADGGEGVVGHGDHGHLVLACQVEDLWRHRVIAGDHQGTHAEFNRRPLRVAAVAHHEEDVGRQALQHGVDLHRADHDPVAEHAPLGRDQHAPAQGAQHIVQVQMDVIQVVQVQPRDEAVGEIFDPGDAAEQPGVVHHRQRADMPLLHDLAHLVKRHILMHRHRGAGHHVGHPRAHIGHQARRRHAEAFQDIGGLAA